MSGRILTAALLAVVRTLCAACLDSEYVGFDSRVSARIVRRLPFSHQRVIGFAVSGNAPIVLLRDRLLLYHSDSPFALTLPYIPNGLTIQADGTVLVQHEDALSAVVNDSLRTAKRLGVRGKLFNSGADVFLDVYPSLGSQEFVLRRAADDYFDVIRIEGELHAAYWGTLGLAAVVGDSLYVWREDAREFVRLSEDKGLSLTRDVCLINDSEVAVALPGAVIIVGDDHQLVLVGMTARCFSQGDELYLLDERTGEIWSVENLSGLGTLKQDQQHAEDLIKNMGPNEQESGPVYLEAARILGCEPAQKLRGARAFN